MTPNGAVNAAVPPARRARFASGAAVRLDLSEGDWVLVRAELTYGQQRRLSTAALTGVDTTAISGERLKVDLAAYDIERLVTWLMDWSFTDGDGDRVRVSREAIEQLHPDTAAEINAALDAHIEAADAKKAPAPPGPSTPGRRSSSATASAGVGTR